MKLSIFCVSLFVLSAFAVDFDEDNVIKMVQEHPEVFLNENSPLSEFEKAFGSMGLQPEELGEVINSVISNVNIKSDKKVSGSVNAPNKTISVSVDKSKEVDFQVKCSRSGRVSKALFNGNTDRTVKGQCGTASFDINRKSQFKGGVEVVHVIGQEHHEIMQLAKDFDLYKQAKDVKKVKGTCICLVGAKFGEDVTIKNKEGVDKCRKDVSVSMLVSKISKVGTRIDGKIVKMCEHEGRHPEITSKKFSINVIH